MTSERDGVDLTWPVTITLETVLDGLGNLPHEELIRLIIELDRRAQEWDVTLPLCGHFAKLRLDYAKEHRDDYPHGCQKDDCKDCKPMTSEERDAVMEEAARACDALYADGLGGAQLCADAIRALQGKPVPARQFCAEGCDLYPRCAHASLPPGVLPESHRQALRDEGAARERAAVVALCESRMDEAVNEGDEIVADIWEAAADAFRRGDHIESPSREAAATEGKVTK